jgi:hypothetical protein
LPYLLVTFGILLVIGGFYRLHARPKTVRA